MDFYKEVLPAYKVFFACVVMFHRYPFANLNSYVSAF